MALAQGPPPPPPPVPIDGGIFGLLALGVGYAVKKIYDNAKN
ncbi:PID-CTERM protein-sorting domain-containing protein [Lutimonas vermicola]|uniref:XapX domain-containing protein n=1 Tax=Lutimonas vermicola TaxID=414288 RepID=A0ABU9L2C9_9FLAO